MSTFLVIILVKISKDEAMMRLRELREEAGLTQKQLAEKIGNVQRNISNWESGASEPDISTVIKLADCFGVSTDELLGKSNSILYEREDSDIDLLLKYYLRLSYGQQQALLQFLKALTEK